MKLDHLWGRIIYGPIYPLWGHPYLWANAKLKLYGWPFIWPLVSLRAHREAALKAIAEKRKFFRKPS